MVRVAERRWMEVKNDESEAGEKRDDEGWRWMEDKIMKNYR